MASVSVVSAMVLLLLLLSRRCDGEDVFCALNDIFDESINVEELEGVWSARKVYAYLDDEATSFVNYQAHFATSDNGDTVQISITSRQTGDTSQCRKLDYTFTKQDNFFEIETVGGASVSVALVFTAVSNSTVPSVGHRALIYICVVISGVHCRAHTALLIYNKDELQSGTVDWMDGLTDKQRSCISGDGIVVGGSDHDCVLDSGAERCVNAHATLIVTIILCLSVTTRLPVFYIN